MMDSSLIPKSISRPKPYLLQVEYTDFTGIIMLSSLREECPCAVCKGEEIMGVRYTFGMQIMKPGMNELVALQPAGNYALQARWNDGHDSGIYTWEQLRTIIEKHALTQEQIQAMNN